MPYKRSIRVIFGQEKWLVENDPLYLKFWARLTPFIRKHWFSIDFRS